jgi:ribonucleoside-diphosphate reductase alpha chain
MALDEILKVLANNAYRTSALLADEKGPFKLFRSEYLDSDFVSRLSSDVRQLVTEKGVRNSHLTSIAPTGTISMTADNVSSGIEPVFAYQVERVYMGRDGAEKVLLEDYGVRFLGVRGRKASEVTIDEHLAVLEVATRWVDSAVSKTLNVPADTPWDQFKDIYFRAWRFGAKGCTTYTMGGKRDGILTDVEGASCRIDPETGRRECE